MAKILLVEDEKNIASFIERGLQEFGHEVHVAHDGLSGWELAQKESFQLLILDIIMPKMNGLELCKQYRKQFGYQSPVIMLTALGTTDDIVSGLDAGADDYLVKPFSFQELQARIKALLRRKGVEETSVATLECGDLRLDTVNHQAIRGKTVIDLTVREYRLLEYLIENKGNAVSRQTLLKQVWDKEDERTNVVDVYVNYLRQKIYKDYKHKMIRTVVGVGYRIDI